ncbi:VP2 [Bluetongue virus]|uniref:Outer capsid protein VP2 n=1 Tax=Bluetongue virus TaxID=40051 RepID=B6SE81_BTV|nr:VP2 [Bluetongue virus]
MDELVIPIFSADEMPYALISHYPLAIQTNRKIQNDREFHDLTKIPQSNMIDISQHGVIRALDYRPSRNDGIVIPRLLDITLHAYDKRRSMKDICGLEFKTDVKWMQWAINDRMDIQPLKVEIDNEHTVNHQLFNCNIKIRSKNVDTVYYDYHPLESEATKCNHANIELMRSLTMVELYHVLQGAAYALKTNFELIATAERGDVRQRYDAAGVRWSRLSRDQRIGYSGNAYDMFMANLVQVEVKGKCADEIAGEMGRLAKIKDKWVSNGFSGTVIFVSELCTEFSAIGRKMMDTHEEPKDEEGISRRFQIELDGMFSAARQENKNVLSQRGSKVTDESKFYALIMIAASDTQQGRVWRTNLYPCLRGALVAAECVMGDVYHTLRTVFNWSVRGTYGGTERNLENNRYIFSRINLFETNLPSGSKIVHWCYEEVAPIETTYDNGYICKSQEGVQNDEKLCKIDDDLYARMRDEAITGGWRQEDFKLHKILTNPNLLTIDFEKEAYITSTSDLILPDYFDKWIKAPIFNARLRITNGVIESEKKSDPWNKRVANGTMKTSAESLGYVLGRFYDLRMQFVEDVLNTRQQKSLALQHIRNLEDFTRLTDYGEEQNICPHAGGAMYTFRRVALEIITNYERLNPMDHEGNEYQTYRHPAIDYSKLGDVLKMKDLSQLICFVFDSIFERRDQLREVGEARMIIYQIQNATGERRLDVLKREFPTFYVWFHRLRDVELIRDLNVINFLPLLFLVRDNAAYRHRQWSIPMILYDEEIKLIPVEVGAYANRFGFKSFINFTRFHPGDARKRQEVSAFHKAYGSICYRYYTDTTISQGEVNVPVITTKLDTLRVHLAALCGGLSDSLVYTLPITHPEKCLVLVIVGDNKLNPQIRSELVISRYRYSRRHIRGVVSVCIDQEGLPNVYSTGIARHKIYEKTVLRYRCKIILVKISGYVFGNDELMTKLLNV